MPSSRVTRGALAAAGDIALLGSRDRLIFAQAVYEYGTKAPAWHEIAKLLSNHPLISRPKNYFNAQSCATIYGYLMKEAGLERTDLSEGKKSQINAQLAQRHYRDRMAELRDEIAAEEERFKTLATEIEDIRAGKWDDRILVKMKGEDVSLDMPSTPIKPTGTLETQPSDTYAVAEEILDQSQSGESAAVQEAESDSEIPMDVSSSVRPSSPPVHTPTEDPSKNDDETFMEVATPEATPTPQTPEAESPRSPKHAKRRHRRRRASQQTAETPEEVEEVADAPEDNQEEVDVEETAEDDEPTEDLRPEDGTPEEPQELTSQESTPAPQGRNEGKRRASDVGATESSRDKKRARDESEPVDSADSPATPSMMHSGPKNTKERKRFQSVITMLHSQITAHRNGTIFHHPIKPSEAPDYRDIVKRPMDLKTIKNRVRDGRINSSNEYHRDICLMFANSLMYNRPNSDIYVMAEEMMHDSEAEIQNFQQTEAFNLRTRN